MNMQRAGVLEDRLRLLDKLEALLESNPNAINYTLTLADLPLHGDAGTANGHIDWLQSERVAVFILPLETNRWNFWDMPVRIKEIDRNRLRELQDQTRSQLQELESISPDMTSVPVASEQRSLVDSRARKFLKANQKTARIIAAIVAFLASIAIILTFISQVLHW
jgi:hypothetical protein